MTRTAVTNLSWYLSPPQLSVEGRGLEERRTSRRMNTINSHYRDKAGLEWKSQNFSEVSEVAKSPQGVTNHKAKSLKTPHQVSHF